MKSNSAHDHLVDLTMSLAVRFKAEPLPVSELLVESMDLAVPTHPESVEFGADDAPTNSISERDEIMRHVAGFRAHQQSVARKREAYYLQERARLRSLLDCA